ncbi:hypothetical protein N431DRAFT_507007 [Stipitochalara longipes BDJ]|nr:hypothetical protein N431DRAFT_507007 [Stipitochalara longipes BDJ]
MIFQTSPFLTVLPLEIRLQIYSEVLSSHTIPLHLTNNGEALTAPRDILAQKLLSLSLTCHQISAESLPLLHTTNTYTVTTPTALRFLSRLPSSHLIRSLNFTFPLPHLPYFNNLPHALSPSHNPFPSKNPHTSYALIENPKDPLQPQDITWIESWAILRQMHGLRNLRVELDVPIFWRRNWCEKENEMLSWLESSGLEASELVVGVLWDEAEGEGRREKFGGETNWRVERLQRKREENDLWEREWGYLVDLSMSA